VTVNNATILSTKQTTISYLKSLNTKNETMTYAEVNPYPDWFNGLSPINAKKNINKQLKKICMDSLPPTYFIISSHVWISRHFSQWK